MDNIKANDLHHAKPSSERAAMGDIHVSFPLADSDMTVGEVIERYTLILEKTNILTIEALSRVDSEHTVVMSFDFPEEVKVPCEQYLLYFVQFLKDAGVEATAELREQAGQVLFAVTPKNQDEALDKIRQALHLYLHLPTNPNLGVVPNLDADIRVQQLAANIYHLRGQLTLASAAMQQQQLTIQQKDLLIEQQQTVIQQQLLTGTILVDSVRDAASEHKHHEEPLLGGTVALSRVEKGGIIVDLAEMYRKLRRFFADENDE